MRGREAVGSFGLIGNAALGDEAGKALPYAFISRLPGFTRVWMARFRPWVAFMVNTTCSGSASKYRAARWRQENSTASACSARA